MAKPNNQSADDLFLRLSTQTISGWLSVHVRRSIETCPSLFDIELTQFQPDTADTVMLKPGDPCQVLLGNDIAMTGYVDVVEGSLNKDTRTWRIAGRGKCQDLVDCSALWDGNQITNSDIRGVAQKLAAPYGITVTSEPFDEAGMIAPMIQFGLGETAYSIIETMARWRAMLVYELPDGSLHLARVGTKRAAGSLKQGVNVESAYFRRDHQEVFSQYEGYLNSTDMFRDAGDLGNRTVTIHEPEVSRLRHKYVQAYLPPLATAKLIDTVSWEANRRFGCAYRLQVVTDSWRDAAGDLYSPNMLIQVDLPSLNTPTQTWLIVDVVYTRDATGTHCELTLMPPDALTVQPPAVDNRFADLTRP